MNRNHPSIPRCSVPHAFSGNLRIQEKGVVGSPAERLATHYTVDTNECLLLRSTRCTNVYSVQVTSGEGGSGSSVRGYSTKTSGAFIRVQMLAKAFRSLPEDKHNGNVLEYVHLHPEVNIYDLVRQMAVALAYAHASGMEHANFCPVCLRPMSRESLLTLGPIRRMFASQIAATCASPTSAWTHFYVTWLGPGAFRESGGTSPLKSCCTVFTLHRPTFIRLHPPFTVRQIFRFPITDG